MPVPVKSERNSRIVRDYLAGIPGRVLAERHGISYGRVQYILKRAGAIPRPRRQLSS